MDEQVSTAEYLVKYFAMVKEGLVTEAEELLAGIVERLRAIDICWEAPEGE